MYFQAKLLINYLSSIGRLAPIVSSIFALESVMSVTATHHTSTSPQLTGQASYLHSKSHGNRMALRHKALICGLGGNTKTTATNEMSYIY